MAIRHHPLFIEAFARARLAPLTSSFPLTNVSLLASQAPSLAKAGHFFAQFSAFRGVADKRETKREIKNVIENNSLYSYDDNYVDNSYISLTSSIKVWYNKSDSFTKSKT